jgi:hypothetical protein
VAQFPNVALWILIAAVALRWIVNTGSGARSVLDGIGVAALAWWALDELFRGVNPWRRLLGLAGCVAVGARLLALLR